jgi:hypothetical protein
MSMRLGAISSPKPESCLPERQKPSPAGQVARRAFYTATFERENEPADVVFPACKRITAWFLSPPAEPPISPRFPSQNGDPGRVAVGAGSAWVIRLAE